MRDSSPFIGEFNQQFYRRIIKILIFLIILSVILSIIFNLNFQFNQKILETRQIIPTTFQSVGDFICKEQ